MAFSISASWFCCTNIFGLLVIWGPIQQKMHQIYIAVCRLLEDGSGSMCIGWFFLYLTFWISLFCVWIWLEEKNVRNPISKECSLFLMRVEWVCWARCPISNAYTATSDKALVCGLHILVHYNRQLVLNKILLKKMKRFKKKTTNAYTATSDSPHTSALRHTTSA